jgi:hypothetical protein
MSFLKSRRRAALGLLLPLIVIGTIILANLDHVFPASSDLTVEYLTWKPEHPVSGGSLSVDAGIRNVGDAQSSDKYTLSMYVDDWWVDGWLVRMTGFQPTVSRKIAPGWMQVWHFRISDYAVFKRGNHQIKAIVSEPNDPNFDNNGLAMTLSISPGDYGGDFNVVNYGMCNRIGEDGLPIGITENYSLDDELAISYFYTDIKHTDWPEKIGSKTNLTFRFYSPNGTLHRENSGGYSILPGRDPSGREITGFALQLLIGKDLQAQGKEGDLMYDPGYQALDKFPGTWRVEVLNKGHLLFTKKFIIEHTSTHTFSTTSPLQLTSSSTSRTEQASTEDLGSVVPGGYPTIVGTIAIMVVGGVILLRRRKRTRLNGGKP